MPDHVSLSELDLALRFTHRGISPALRIALRRAYARILNSDAHVFRKVDRVVDVDVHVDILVTVIAFQ